MANTALNRTVVALLTNKSGGSLNYGDVVIGDTSNAEGFTTTTSSGYNDTEVGVIIEPNGIANNASGMVATCGWVPKINLNTAATAWQWIKTHTVAGQGTPHSAPMASGDFAIALDASATPAAILLGKPNQSAGAGTVTNTGTLTANALVVGNGGVDVKVATTGTGILTALAANVGSAGAPVTFNGALGTPSSGTLTNGTGLPFTTGLTGISSAYVNLQDQKAQNTNGGTFTSGSWQTRTLNTEVNDVGGLCSLASNQFTLTAGTYLIAARAPCYAVGRHQARLQNVTDASTVLTGMSMFNGSADNGMNSAPVNGLFTIGASKALEIQHQCQITSATLGFGVACNFTTEVYAVVELWKIG